MDIKNQNQPTIPQFQLPTQKQIERAIAQKFCTWHRQRLGCLPQEATCTLFNRFLIIMAENASTPLERIMHQKGETKMIDAVRPSINRILKHELGEIIEEITLVKVSDLICELNFDSHRLIASVILEQEPSTRSKKAKKKFVNKSNI
ncbi:MAG: Na-translocating system protein MpsC family protein [Cyanobacteria bacterium P01_A01_bin.83]